MTLTDDVYPSTEWQNAKGVLEDASTAEKRDGHARVPLRDLL